MHDDWRTTEAVRFCVDLEAAVLALSRQRSVRFARAISVTAGRFNVTVELGMSGCGRSRNGRFSNATVQTGYTKQFRADDSFGK